MIAKSTFFLCLVSFGLVVFVLTFVSSPTDEVLKYDDAQSVPTFVNKIGPYNNPQETYTYYSLPYCRPDFVRKKSPGLGEALEGNQLMTAPFEILFKQDKPQSVICTIDLNEKNFQKFQYAVKHHYWYQLYVDNLPVWGLVGEIGQGINVDENGEHRVNEYFVYTHQKFSISFNDNHVVEVNMTAEAPVQLRLGSTLHYSYSVNWVQTDSPYADRMLKFLDNNFFEHKIHWFSIFNSFMMVVFLAGLVAMILLRTLKNDYARYSKFDEDDGFESDRDFSDETGWKLVHADVFRPPPNLSLFSAIIGTGLQLTLLSFCVIFCAFAFELYYGRGVITNAFIVSYAFTSLVAGFGSARYYFLNGGTNWIRTMTMTAFLFPSVAFVLNVLLNMVGLGYQSLSVIPLKSMIFVLLIWAFATIPLILLGTILGRSVADGNADIQKRRFSPIPRPIPEKKWFMSFPVIIPLGGILPFGSIFIEMYFIFTSFWNYKFYYVYGFMLLVFTILIVVTVCVTIVSTYFLLNAEDYRWPWASFLSAGSTAVYVFLYSVYYFISKTHMSGFLQSAYYFGYMSLFCFALTMMCGTIGFFGSQLFVRHIFSVIKSD